MAGTGRPTRCRRPGATVHLAHPLGVKGFRYRRTTFATPGIWRIAAAEPAARGVDRPATDTGAAGVGALPGQARHTAHLAKAGLLIPVSDLFGVEGREHLTQVPLGVAYAQRMTSLLELIDVLDAHEGRFFDQIAAELRDHPGYRAIQELPGVGPTLAAVFVGVSVRRNCPGIFTNNEIYRRDGTRYSTWLADPRTHSSTRATPSIGTNWNSCCCHDAAFTTPWWSAAPFPASGRCLSLSWWQKPRRASPPRN